MFGVQRSVLVVRAGMLAYLYGVSGFALCATVHPARKLQGRALELAASIVSQLCDVSHATVLATLSHTCLLCCCRHLRSSLCCW